MTHPVALGVHVAKVPRAEHAQVDGDDGLCEGASLVRPDVNALDGERLRSPLGEWGEFNGP